MIAIIDKRISILENLANRDILKKIQEKFPEVFGWITDAEMYGPNEKIRISRIRKKYKLKITTVHNMIAEVKNYILSM